MPMLPGAAQRPRQLGLSLYSISHKPMIVSSASMKQKRLSTLAKGVKAAGLTIERKFSDLYGHPELTEHAKGLRYTRTSPYRAALVTLTYAQDGVWESGHISALMNHYRNWFSRNAKGCKFHCVWVMELTQIGRPHYHLVIWMPRGVRPPLPDKQGWWPHGMTQAVFAHSPVGYITKYASKGETKSGMHLPKRARLWGYSGLALDERAYIAYALAPRWLKGLIGLESHPAKRSITLHEKGKYGSTSVNKVAAWVLLAAGASQGYAFFSPYDYDGFTPDGIALSHRGYVEVLTPDGDAFHIPHRGQA